MNFRSFIVATATVFIILGTIKPVFTSEGESILQQSMSETLDLWRDARYEQLFERLSHRGKTSRESFVKKMHDTNVRPSCCWQKMENFKVLNEKRTDATVYVKIGLEGTPQVSESVTREFKLTHEEGVWKMQLSDILSIAGVTGKKGRHISKKSKKNLPHNN